jgi:hypothetical protein
MAVTRKRHFDHTVEIDGEPVRLKIARLTVPQYEAFNAQFAAYKDGRGAPTLKDGQEDSLEQVQREIAYRKANADWLLDTFEQYLTVVEGDLLDEDENGQMVVVTSGLQFAQMFSGQESLIGSVLAEIWLQNRLTESQKKTLQLLRASASGSTPTPSPEPPGERPEPTATAAEIEASVDAAAVTDARNDTSSGTTDRSS